MKIYPEEYESAKQYQETCDVPRFSAEQLQEIRNVGKRYAKWTHAHPYLHNAINVTVLLFLFAACGLALIGIPLLLWAGSDSPLQFCLALVVSSFVHGYLSYSVIVFSMHEGAGHDRIIQRKGPISNFLAFLANNACRVFFADPIYYRNRHVHHHKDFATYEDGAFTNFVHPRRFWLSLLPFAGMLSFNDYRIHMDTKWTISRLASMLVGLSYIGAMGLVMSRVFDFGFVFTFLVLAILSPWFSFLLDRLRETTEHNLMALETPNGARNLGCGFWGMLVGGGPWGQPCHLSHHLIPALPWYQQCMLHRKLKKLMTPAQRRYFTISPIFGFPKLLLRVVRENHKWIPVWGRTKQPSGLRS